MSSTDRNNQNTFLWALVAIVPLGFMAVSFFHDQWTWGLADDTGYLHIQGGWWPWTKKYFLALFSWGECRPTYAAYVATFYPLFHNAPKLFYLFKLILVAGTLMMWGYSARLLTKKPLAQFLLPSIVLSYYFFYDTMEYLSAQEPLGLFFLSLALLCFISAGVLPAEQKKPIRWEWLLVGLALLVFSAFSKEMFVTCALALSGMLFLTSIIYRNRPLRWWGTILFLFFLAYALYLKFWFQHGYTAGYSFKDWGKISWNLRDWLTRSFIFHLPWLLVAIIFGSKRILRREPIPINKLGTIGLATGAVLYFSYLIVLLPWQVSDFYAAPLGVFFAFFATLFLADDLERCKGWLIKTIIGLMLMFNIGVCYCSFGKMVAYRNDTIQLLDWLTYNQEFRAAMERGWKVSTNAWEAGDTIPALLEIRTGIKIPSFSHVTLVKEIIYTPRTLYYLYNPSLGDQDLRLIHQLYSVVFSSRSWTLFERNIL